MPNHVIHFLHVSKEFDLHHNRARSFQDLFLSLFRPKQAALDRELDALQDVTFDISSGETVGIIGPNGSGKSTCLKLLARILEPSSGTVAVQGRVSALLELGAGFHPELTGRENIFLYGSILGIRRRELAERFDEIVSFAELERFIDVPVKFYSSGMYVRLGFATAISVEPDILLVDEVLAVGDQSFQAKCIERIQLLNERGMTIVFVSHDLASVGDLCRRVIWLDHGVLRVDGPAEESIAAYLETVENSHDEEGQPVAAPTIVEEPILARARRGDLTVRIDEARFFGDDGTEVDVLPVHTRARLKLQYSCDMRVQDPVFGIGVHRASDGLYVLGTNTSLAGHTIDSILGSGEVTLTIPDLDLLPGEYSLSVAVHSRDEQAAYDYQDNYYRFTVSGDRDQARAEGVYCMNGQWSHLATSSGKERAK